MSPLRAIREATAADAAVIARIVNLAYEVERVFLDGDRTSEAEVRRHLEHGRFLLLEEDREPVGCVYIEQKGERGYLGMLSVLPDRQGGGRGRALVEAVERACRAAGCTCVDLWIVDLRDELPGFYRRLGYQATGEKPFTDPRLKRAARFLIYTKPLGPE
jgi:GNAT superfamily N-acetyltransferase